MDLKTQATRLSNLLKLRSQPIAVSFQKGAPAGVKRVESTGPAGCSYWKLAAQGNVFYTEAEDHYNCTIGAYTHGVTLPADKENELKSVIGTMVQLEYIKTEEVQDIPHRTESFAFAVYAPLSESPIAPDVVMLRGNAKQVMLVVEAARAVCIGHEGAMMVRPTCAMIPETINSSRGNASLGCIGNRVYTELEDDELYFSIPGSRVGEVVDKLETIINANNELQRFYATRVGGAC